MPRSDPFCMPMYLLKQPTMQQSIKPPKIKQPYYSPMQPSIKPPKIYSYPSKYIKKGYPKHYKNWAGPPFIRFGKVLNLTKHQVRYRLYSWSLDIRKDQSCVYCGDCKNLNAHHLLPKHKYPGLMLLENNGVPLCDTCHREHHSLNGNN